MSDSDLSVSEDFECLLHLLPDGWQEKARELGALRRCRKVPDAERLLRVLLIHLAEGCSLRETSVRARRGGVVDLSDVAIMDRLRNSGEWFRWMNAGLMQRWVVRQPAHVFGAKGNVRVVDGTRVKEPGRTGSSWCIHYAIGLPSLECSEFEVCDKHGNGESFTRFSVHPGDLFIGDRVYGVRPGILHVVQGGGDVLVRFVMDNLPLWTRRGASLDLLKRLRTLRGTKIGQWPVALECKGRVVEGRVCAIKKSRQATQKAQQRVRRQSQKAGTKPRAKTLEAAGYTFVFTTVAREELGPTGVLEMYRGRWQVELVFKRLKSILGLGHLRKYDEQATMAWIQGKLFVAFLVETLIRYAEGSFFPWGYPLYETAEPKPLSVEGGAIHASFASKDH